MTAKIAHLPPTAEGLDTVDCTGVQIGNSDIEASSTQGGAVGEFERPTLPGCEHQPSLPPYPHAARPMAMHDTRQLVREERAEQVAGRVAITVAALGLVAVVGWLL